MIATVFSPGSVVKSFNLLCLHRMFFAVENRCDLLSTPLTCIEQCHDHMTDLGPREGDNHFD